MQEVKMSQETFDLLEKNTILEYEQAQWFMQIEGFIPIPRKSNKKNIKVIFIPNDFWGSIYLTKLKVKKYRISQIIDKNYILGYIITFETSYSTSKLNRYFVEADDNVIYKLSKDESLEVFDYLIDGTQEIIFDF